MTTERAIEILELWKQGLRLNPYEVDEAFAMAIKALEQQRWIPVSERLPEEDGEYLVWYNCGDDEEGYMVVNFDAEMGAFGYWYDEYDDYTLGFVDSEFIECETAVAWQPLPEPYKGEE